MKVSRVLISQEGVFVERLSEFPFGQADQFPFGSRKIDFPRNLVRRYHQRTRDERFVEEFVQLFAHSPAGHYVDVQRQMVVAFDIGSS